MMLADYPGNLVAASLLAGAALLMLFAYRSNIVRSAGAWRWLLAALQYASVALVLIILWNPSSPSPVEKSSKNTVLAVFDTSESMSVADDAGAAAKTDAAASRLDKAVEAFKAKFKPDSPESPLYSVHGFDAGCYAAGSLEALRRWGQQTNAHGAMSLLDRYDLERLPGKGAVSDARTSNVVGAVIFTDGQADDKNVQSYFPLKAGGLKVLFVGIGSDRAPRDVAVTSVRSPGMVALNTPYAVEVDVKATGGASERVSVTVLDNDVVADVREVNLKQGADAATLQFTLGARVLGRHRIKAVARAAAEDTNLANNERQAVVEVVEVPRMKVLLYSQTASFDFGKIRSSLERDKKIDLDVGLDAVISPDMAEKARSSSGNVPLPADKAGFYAYDVIVLGPIKETKLTPAQVDGLYSFVTERGGGLVVLPGRADYDVSAWTSEKLKALLPVELAKANDVALTLREPLELTLAGADAGFLSKTDLADTPLEIAAYHAGAEGKPAAYVWARSGQRPLISVHRVGRGKVCFINGYGLYRWYREDLDGGALRKLMSSLTATLGRIRSPESRIELFAARRTDDPLKVSFDASVYDDAWAPVEGATVLLAVAGNTFRMEQVAAGRYAVEIPGILDESVFATVEAERAGRFIGEKVVAASLPRPRMEMDRVESDRKFLQALAKRVGGEYRDVAALEADASSIFPAASRSYEGGFQSAWRTWPLLVALCVFLSATWFIRRAIGLV